MGEKVCRVCGMTYDEISKTQKIGCAECYYTFKEEFQRTLKKYGISGAYQGSFPKKLKGYRSTLTSRVEMQFKLEAALAAEEYEKAAFYRDYLKVLNNEAYKNSSDKTVSFDTASDSDIDIEKAAEKSGEDDGRK